MIVFDRRAPSAKPLVVNVDGVYTSTACWNAYDARLARLSKNEGKRYSSHDTWRATDRFWYDRGFSEGLLMLDLHNESEAVDRAEFFDDLVKDCRSCISQWWDKGLADALKVSKLSHG